MPGITPSSDSNSCGAIAGVATGLIPCRMAVVAEDQFRRDAADFAGGAGALDVRQVVEEIHRAGQTLGQRGIFARLAASNSTTSRMNCRAASSQQSASASGKVTPWRVLW